VDFLSRQEFDVNATTDIQKAQQTTTLDSDTTTTGGPNAGMVEKYFSYPLNVDYAFIVNPDGSFSQTTTSEQQDLVHVFDNPRGSKTMISDLSNHVNATDTLNWDTSGNLIGPTGAHTTQTYRLQEPSRGCYNRTITAENQKLVSVTNGPGCSH
jgi:hypothetical protein